MWNDHLPAECSVLLWLNEFKEPLTTTVFQTERLI